MPNVDFFISYTSNDVGWARWIAWELERAGFTTTYQDRDFVPGRAFMQQMRAAVKNARRTVAVLSPDYFDSEFAALELNAALAADPTGSERKLIPIRVKMCTPDELLRDRVYIDLTTLPAKTSARRALLDGVRAAVLTMRKGAAGTRGPAFPPEEERRRGGKRTASVEELAPAGDPGKASDPVYPLKVLFMASEAGTGLDLRGQCASIRRAVRNSSQPSAIKVDAVFDVTTSTFFDALNRFSPHIVHFSGKQDGGDILIRTEAGTVTTLTDRELAGMLRSLDEAVRMVIIDTCYSLRCASSISHAVDFALGVKSFIYEDAATEFYSTFYQALAAGRSVENAASQARTRLRMSKTPAAQIPQLRCRTGADAKSRLVEVRQSQTQPARNGKNRRP